MARGGEAALQSLLAKLGPISIMALLATLVLLFGFQGQQILAQPLVIAMLAVPILIQVYFNSGLAYVLNRAAGEAHCVAARICMFLALMGSGSVLRMKISCSPPAVMLA